MEPVGPWFSAVSYNRFAGNQQCGVQNGSYDAELFSNGVVSAHQPQSSSTTQLFFGGAHHSGSNFPGPPISPFPPPPPPSGFLSPAPVTVPYDSSVFNSIFHQKSHYRAFKQPEVDNFNFISTPGSGSYFDQGNSTPMAWGQNSQLQSPFGVLPHESAIQNASVVKPYDNLGHFAPQPLNQFNSQSDYENRNFGASLRANPPMLLSQAVDDYQKFHKAHFQPQSFASVQDGRFPQSSFRGNQIIPRNEQCDCGPQCVRPILGSEPKTCNIAVQDQSSPISYALFDSQRNFEGNRIEPHSFANQLTYNRFGPPDDCIEKSGSRVMKNLDSYNSRPLIPCDNAYPLYCHSSPVTQSSSNSSPSPIDPSSVAPPIQPSQDFNTREPVARVMSPAENPPLDVTIPRPLSYSTAPPSKPLADRNFIQTRSFNETWEGREKTAFSSTPLLRNGCTPMDAGQSTYHYQSLTSCRGDPMSLVKTLQQQNHSSSHFVESDKKFGGSGGNWRGTDIFNRIPPPAHHNAFNQVQSGYFDFDRWNSAKMFTAPTTFPACHAPTNGKFPIHATPGPHLQHQASLKHPYPLPSPAPPSTVEEEPLIEANPIASISNNNEARNEATSGEESVQESPEPPPKKTEAGKSTQPLTVEEELNFLDTTRLSPIVSLQAETQLNPELGFSGEFFKFLKCNTRKTSTKESDKPECQTNTALKRTKLPNSANCNKMDKAAVDLSGKGSSKVFQKPALGGLSAGNGINSGHSVPELEAQISKEFPFKFGEFVVVKNDRSLLHPPLWKVKKNQLLQKFTHFVSRGVAFYSNVPVFTGWSPLSKKIYEKVVVIVVKQQKEDSIVKLASSNLLCSSYNRDNVATREPKYDQLREAFEVYLQTLLSQALDSKFLKEIHLDKEEYFLNYIRTVESFWSELISKLKSAVSWDESTVELMTKAPNYRYVDRTLGEDKCACSSGDVSSCISIGGLSYLSATLELTKTPIPHQIITLCDECKVNFELLHKLSHQKYLLFSICNDVVSSRKTEQFDVDAPGLLKDLLEDGDWSKRMFHEFSTLCDYAERITANLLRNKKLNSEHSKK